MINSSSKRDGVLVGAVIILIAAILAWQTAIIPSGAIYAEIGPKIVPWIVTVLLGSLGLAIIFESYLGLWQVDTEHGSFDRASLIWIGLGLGLNLVLIDLVGFILASATLFVCTARAFGSARPLRDAGIGFAVALIAYAGFDRLLDYRIGDGLIENLI
nr:MAG: tripartite tricarboxylate transporter TctB family protein [Hyphomicrobiales bacterium]